MAPPSADDTEQAVYIQRIDPEQKENYIDAHDDVPSAVTEAMRRSGVTDFRLYVRDDIAVCVVEAEDIDAYIEEVDTDPEVADWERYVAQFKRSGVDVDSDAEQIPFMDEIWSFSPNDT